ncbi:hypothetical protein ES708_11387 [subsurface metagenome]
MPGGDRTGPTGMGPMTGRGVGYCAGYQVPGFANPIPGGEVLEEVRVLPVEEAGAVVTGFMRPA